MATTAWQRKALGGYGERVAARYLTQQGMAVLESNWRCRAGELDLVLRDGSDLVVCEVKTRSSTEYGTPHEAIDSAKLERLRRLAETWAQQRLGRLPPIRIDLVAVIADGHGAARVDHVAGIG